MKRFKILAVRVLGAAMTSLLAAGGAQAAAQTHKVAKPETIVRAVGVYEWTGDIAKPTSSRLIPVSIFIDGKLEDAGVYLARPVPFALESGIVYELEQAGVPIGALDLAFARHLQTAENAPVQYDEGWFGYGSYIPPAAPKKTEISAKRQSTAAVVGSKSDDPDRPHFSNRSDGGGSASTSGPDSKDSGNAATTDGADSAGKTQASTKAADKEPTSKEPTSAGSDDPDRPTLRRRSPEDAKKAKKNDEASVSAVSGSLNDDPDRPKVKRGKPPSAMTEDDLPKLKGLPKDVHQMVGISDAATRPVHYFARAWENDGERAAVMAKMRALAMAELAGYRGATPGSPAGTPPPRKRADRTGAASAQARGPGVKTRRGIRHDEELLPATGLVDEDLRGFLLSYGGQPTFVYQARTDGDGAGLLYVTVVAQEDGTSMKIAMKSVTDALHLDRTPWMRLVDVVDAEASNRASLLFELRAQNSRSFGLYRVIGARSEALFSTGATP